MARLALVLGVSGCGKGYVANNCRPKPQVITVDWVREKAISILCPNLPTSEKYRFEIWDRLSTEANTVSAIASSIRDLHKGIELTTNTISEGSLLAHQGFRGVFLEALAELGGCFSETEMFFINPEPNCVFEYVQKRGRSGEMKRSLKEIEGEIQWYRRLMAPLKCARFESSDETRCSVEAFFSRDVIA